MAVRIAFDNGPGQAEALRVTDAGLAATFSARPDLLARIDPVICDSEAGWQAEARIAEVVFAGRHAGLPPGGAPRLRWLHSTSAGVEDYCRILPADVMLTNSSGVHGDKGGEFILAAALMLNYHIPKFVSDKAAERWAPVFGGPLRGKVVTILGVGEIGRAGARALRGSGARLIGVTRSGQPVPEIEEMVPVDRLDEVLARTDIFVSTAPLTPATAGLVDARRLGLLAQGAGIVVVGRAGVLDYGALEAGLRSGRFGGAVLDVFEAEPVPPGHALWNCPNLIMTPHCSLDDHARYLDGCLALFAANLERYLGGRPLENLVDKARGY